MCFDESHLLDDDGVCGSGKQQGEGGASYSRPECSPLRRLHDTCMPDSRGSAARQAASTSRKIMVDVSVRVRKGRIYPIAWSSNGPESSLVHVVVFFAKHFRILVSFRARSLGHRSIGIRPPHTWCLSAWRTLLLQGKANGHTSSH